MTPTGVQSAGGVEFGDEDSAARLRRAGAREAAVGSPLAQLHVVRIADLQRDWLRHGLAEVAKTVAKIEKVVAGESKAADQEGDRKKGRSEFEFDAGDELPVGVRQPEPRDSAVRKATS